MSGSLHHYLSGVVRSLTRVLAVIVTAPVSTAVTTPLDVTVALVGLLELHVTVRETVFPFTSFTVAMSGVD